MAGMLGWIGRRLERLPLGGPGVELLISLYLVACGLAWASGGNGMAGISSYRIMLQVMPDDVWGAVWAAIGLAWMAAGHFAQQRIRRAAAIMATGLLVWCGATFVLSNPATALGWGLIVLGAGSAGAAVHIR